MTKDKDRSYTTNGLEPSMGRKHLFWKNKIDFNFNFNHISSSFDQDMRV